MTRLLIGLGNARPDLLHTRHNLGRDLLTWLEPDPARWREEPGCAVSAATVDGHDVTLVWPTQGDLNSSGAALETWLASWPELSVVPARDVIVAYDHMDLPQGEVRLRLRGSDGGHRGLRDILRLWGPDVPRLGLGIGRPAGVTVREHVNGAWSDAERENHTPQFQRAYVALARHLAR